MGTLEDAATATLEALRVLGRPAHPEQTLRVDVEAPAAAPAQLSAPDGYEARGQLGQGSVGTVLLAKEHALGRDVAVKMLRPGSSQAAHASLLAEAKVLAALEHPAIPPVYSLGKQDGEPFVAMRRIEGKTLKELLVEPDHPLWAEWSMATGDRFVAVVEILTRVAEALAHAHERGFVHRDVKPANILVGSLGQAFLVDWGLAIQSGAPASKTLAGTPAFIAPEMLTGGILDARTDVYLLGATLHSVLSGGASKHLGRTIEQVLAAALVSDPVDYGPSVPEQLAWLANRSTSRDPAARPQSALEVRDELRAYRRNRTAESFLRSGEKPLVELEALVGRGEDDALATAEKLASVCRFVHRQAREMASNAGLGARDSQRVSVALARIHLGRGDVAGARVAAAEVHGPVREEIERALEAIERDKHAEHERVHALKRTVGELDPLVGTKPRIGLIAGFSVMLVIAILLGRSLVRVDTPDYGPLFAISVLFLVVVSATTWSLRRRLRDSRPNQVLAAALVTSVAARLLMRIVDWGHAVPSLVTSFGRDLALFSGLVAVAAVATRIGVLYAIAGMLALGALGTALFPAATMTLFELTMAAVFLLGVVVTVRMMRKG